MTNEVSTGGSAVAIEVQDLVKHYMLGNKMLRVLKGINFKINPGEFIILFGPSGSGKTTLLNLLAGLDKLTSGKILINGEDIALADSNRLALHRLTKIGMVFQDFNLISAMTAQENVAMPLIFNNVPLKERMRKAKQLLKEIGLGDRYTHKPVELSGGQQQRVAIARSLVNNPEIMLVDEPTGNLDTEAANEIMKLIINLNKEYKRTIVLVTHNPNYLCVADRVFTLQDGLIISEMKDKK